MEQMFQFPPCNQDQGRTFISPVLRLRVHSDTLTQKSVQSVPRFKTLMTNKTEHDSHGSKTVEISDMKYNIFKVCTCPFYLLTVPEAKTKPRLNITDNLN